MVVAFARNAPASTGQTEPGHRAADDLLAAALGVVQWPIVQRLGWRARRGVASPQGGAGKTYPIAAPFAGTLRIQAWCFGAMAETSMEHLKRLISDFSVSWEPSMPLSITVADGTRLAGPADHEVPAYHAP